MNLLNFENGIELNMGYAGGVRRSRASVTRRMASLAPIKPFNVQWTPLLSGFSVYIPRSQRAFFCSLDFSFNRSTDCLFSCLPLPPH